MSGSIRVSFLTVLLAAHQPATGSDHHRDARPLPTLVAATAGGAFSSINDRAAPKRVVCVVVPNALKQPLQRWVESRRRLGYKVTVIDSSESRSSTTAVGIADLQRRIAAVFPAAESPRPTGFVLIVGDAPAPREPIDWNQHVPGEIVRSAAHPAQRLEFVSDNIYGLPDATGMPRLAVGRWPVRSKQQVRTQVEKSISHRANEHPGPHRAGMTFLATTPNYAPLLDPMLERLAISMINRHIGPEWDLRALYGSASSPFFPGARNAAWQCIQWLNQPTPLTLFAGHGHTQGVDLIRFENSYYPVMNVQLAEKVANVRAGTMMWFSACSCGDFDLPGNDLCLAESLVLNPKGPISVVSGTDRTSPLSNLLMCTGLSSGVVQQRPGTLGEAFWITKKAMGGRASPLMNSLLLSLEKPEFPEKLPGDHYYLYNLLGDPTVPLQLPRRLDGQHRITRALDETTGQVTIKIDAELDQPLSGRAWVSLVRDRMEMNREELGRIKPDQKPDFPERFDRMNNRVVASGECCVAASRFSCELTLPARDAAACRWIHVYAADHPERQDWWDGILAWKIERDEPEQP